MNLLAQMLVKMYNPKTSADSLKPKRKALHRVNNLPLPMWEPSYCAAYLMSIIRKACKEEQSLWYAASKPHRTYS